MSTFNRVTMVGNLGSDPVLRQTKSGKPVCVFSVATDEEWVDDQGNKKKHTTWLRVVTWNKMAVNCHKYLSKGRQVLVEGRLRGTSWTDKDSVERHGIEVVAFKVEFLGGRKASN